MSKLENTLPHWDLSAVYPGIKSAEFAKGFSSTIKAIEELTALFDECQIFGREPAPLDEETVRVFEALVARMNEVLEQSRTMYSYLYAHIATDSRDEAAQARWSEYQQAAVRLSLLGTRFTAWISSLDVDALLERSALAREHVFVLRKAQEEAEHLMSPEEEALAAELGLVGAKAWAKLHGTFNSQLIVPLEVEGEAQQLPMSVVRNLAYHPDRKVRQAAYEAELDAWKRAEIPIVAAMNGIKGQISMLARRRKWNTPLDVALFANNIGQQTLDAMMGAARETFPDFRRYLRAKAQALGLPVLAWYDIFAPVGSAQRKWTFVDAQQFILDQFGTYSDRLRGLAERAFREEWIDAEPRAGKRDGAFCMWIKDDRSLVLTNYKTVYSGVSTLAHELGHAYHSYNLSSRPMLQRSTPMTLAETASIFCQTIVRQAALAEATAEEQLTILEAELQNACQVVVDISSRFLFEQNLFAQRERRELSSSECCQLMVAAQKETYGDGLDPDQLHPYLWAAKPHYYYSSLPFYNFPYMFGLLFGLGLYAQYQADPDGFRTGYDDLLSSTGMDDASSLAARFGIDICSPDFWRASLDVIRSDIDRFESLVDQLSG
jgi:pepF/M3 family oligoendopeptidase